MGWSSSGSSSSSSASSGLFLAGAGAVVLGVDWVERWKENDENGYHGNKLHKLKMSSVLPTLNFIIT